MSKGRFVWYQLLTPDPAKAKAFYTSLFPWVVDPQDMGELGTYDQLTLDGQGFGGVMNNAMMGGGPGYWTTFISTDDVDASAKEVEELGGKIISPPENIPMVGRFAVLQDPQGAYFHLFRWVDGAPEQPEGGPENPVGSVAWKELTTSDVEGAARFYTALFGWTRQEMPMGDLQYNIFKRGEHSEAGMMLQPPMAPVAWTFYFEVADVDAARAKVVELGGSTMTEIMDVEGAGRFSIVADPTGGVFAIIQSAPMS